MQTSPTTLDQKLVVCQQVAKLVRAKLPIAGQLSSSTQNESKPIRELADAVDQGVAQGKSLANALSLDDSPDSCILAACIEAGEESNRLDLTLQNWASMHIANAKAKAAFRTALLYPCMLILVTLVSLALVIWTLVPHYQLTYEMFEQEMPSWLSAVIWVRSNLVLLLVLLLVLCVAPLFIWFVMQRGRNAQGMPKEVTHRVRLQSLATESIAQMVDSGMPLKKIVGIGTRVAGGSNEDGEQAFSRIQSQQRVPQLAREASMLLGSLHAGIIDPNETAHNLREVARHLQMSAEISAARQSRWVPMLVALTVGLLTVLTYVFIIYLPWIWLMMKIITPDAVEM